MGELLKNKRVLGGAVALIGAVVAAGVYQPDATGEASLVAVVGACGAAAVAAVVAFAAKKKAPEEPGK